MVLYIVWLTVKYVVSIFLNPFGILDLTGNDNTIDVRFCQVMACIWSDILERQKPWEISRERLRRCPLGNRRHTMAWSIGIGRDEEYPTKVNQAARMERKDIYCSYILKLNIRSSISASQCFMLIDVYGECTTLLFWCVGRMVKLSPFHGDDAGSIPARIIFVIKLT